jgi:glycosyltransferase involved in cell wall biosynthesis
VLEVMAHLPYVHLAVIGPRWAKQDAELIKAVQAAGLDARVHLLEPVAPAEVITAISDADVSLCLFQDTSLNQRFAMPNKLFESLLAGVPLLVSALPDMADLVHRMKAGLAVDQTDPDAVTDAIRTLLERRADFVPAGEARAELMQSCSWEGQERTLLALYERLLTDVGTA